MSLEIGVQVAVIEAAARLCDVPFTYARKFFDPIWEEYRHEAATLDHTVRMIHDLGRAIKDDQQSHIPKADLC